MTFASFDLPRPLLDALATRGFDAPTPVQAAILAPENHGGDLLVSSRTGSGKTVAFGLALSQEILEAEPAAPVALVVAPTRELAQQVQRELQWLFGSAGTRVVSCVGGMDPRREQRMLSQGVQVVVGTPGRLCDHLDRRSLDLRNLKAVVLDEADEMLDMGFRDELERILGAAPADRRTLLFSATLPRGIEELASRYQRNARRIAATAPDQAHQDIEYVCHPIAVREREHAVVNVLRYHDASRSLVFCGTRDAVNRLHTSLSERGFSAVALSGELTQAERNRALQALRDGRARVLVATDVAARGLDLPEVGLVIHADLPVDTAVLQHRSGRTGRAGRKGVAVLLSPSSKRRTAERLLSGAKVRAKWSDVPGVEAIAEKDRQALEKELSKLASECPEEELDLARELLEKHGAEGLVAALVRQIKSRWPAAEDLPLSAGMADRPVASGKEKPQRPFGDRGGKAPFGRRERGFERGADRGFERGADRGHGGERGAERRFVPSLSPDEGAFRPSDADRRPRDFAPRGRGPDDRQERGPRPQRGNPDAVWFRVNVGRAAQADPRWLVPMICRRGQIAKAEIGRIQILPRETRFEISPQAASHFDHWSKQPDHKEPNIRFEPVA